MKYRVEYQSAINNEIKVAIIEANSEQSATRKLVEDRDKYPRRIISCRRIDDSMKKYKIGNRIIKADSPTKALQINKMLDSTKDDVSYDSRLYNAMSEIRELCVKNNWYTKGSTADYSKMLKGANDGWTIAELAKDIASHSDGVWTSDVAKEIRRFAEKNHLEVKNYVKDNDESEIDKLSEEERQAIEDYKNAIMKTNDVKLLKLFAHILKEETEHLEELQSEEVEDSVNDDRLSPMTYKKLKELGVRPQQWRNWSQEQANRFIASKEQGVSEKKVSSKEESSKKVKGIKNPEAMEKELQRLFGKSVEYGGDAYNEDDDDVFIFTDGSKETARKISKYFKEKGYTGVDIDKDFDGNYSVMVHAIID